MSLETAQKFWKDERAEPMREWLLENFTKEELEGKKGFTWNDCFPLRGFCFDDKAGFIQRIGGDEFRFVNNNKHVFKTEAQAKSTIAFAQLSHIVAKYNDEYEPLELKRKHCIIFCKKKETLRVTDIPLSGIKRHLEFNDKDAAIISLEVNRQLWLDYWMVEETNK